MAIENVSGKHEIVYSKALLSQMTYKELLVLTTLAEHSLDDTIALTGIDINKITKIKHGIVLKEQMANTRSKRKSKHDKPKI